MAGTGFQWLWPSLPPVFEKHIPIFKPRPSRLLARCEYSLKIISFKRRFATKPVSQLPSISKLMQTRYAEAYRELIELARTNGIRLVIANDPMAINSASDRAVIEFHRESFPAVHAFIKVNVLHSMLVTELARQHPEVCFVDTNPGLDREHQKFIDLVHFAPEGDRQMAETVFEAIKDVLGSDL